MTATQFKASVTYGQVAGLINHFEQVALVGAGFNLRQTSVSDTRSGIAYAAYQQRGFTSNKTVGEVLNDSYQTKTNAKVYLATEVGHGIGAGYVLGGSYRPRTEEEATSFMDADYVFLDDEPLPTPAGFAVTHDSYKGPLLLYGRNAGGAWIPATTTAIYNSWGADVEIAIAAESFSRNHTVIIAIEGAQPGSNFELNFDAHYEGIPLNMLSAVETREAPLPEQYSTTLDVLRKFHDGQLKVPMSSIYMDDLALLGIFGDGFFKKASDFIKRGLQNISKIEPVRQIILNMLPKAVGSLASKIPVLDAFKDDIVNALTDKANELMGINNNNNQEEELKVSGRRWNNFSVYSAGNQITNARQEVIKTDGDHQAIPKGVYEHTVNMTIHPKMPTGAQITSVRTDHKNGYGSNVLHICCIITYKGHTNRLFSIALPLFCRTPYAPQTAVLKEEYVQHEDSFVVAIKINGLDNNWGVTDEYVNIEVGRQGNPTMLLEEN